MQTVRARPPLTRGGLLAILAAIAVATSGCGSSSTPGGDTTATQAKSSLEGLTADQVLAKAKEAALAQTSVHVKGGGTSSGDTVNIDIRLTKGEGGAGTFGFGQGAADFIAKGDFAWVKGDEAFYKSTLGDRYSADAGKLIAGKYIKIPKSAPQFADLAGLLDFERFLNNTLQPDGKITRVPGKPIGGVPTVGLNDDAQEGGVLYVADDGSNLPLALEPGGGGGDSGAINLTEWGATFQFTEPPADQVFDVSKLIGG